MPSLHPYHFCRKCLLFSIYMYRHTVQVSWVQVEYLHWCTSGVYLLADGRKTTTSASCSRCWPPHVQVEYLHRLMERIHHQHMVQRSGPASGQVRAGCSNSMQLQPPYHRPDQDLHKCCWIARCSNQCNLCKGTPDNLYMPLRKLHWLLHWALQRHPCWSWSGRW